MGVRRPGDRGAQAEAGSGSMVTRVQKTVEVPLIEYVDNHVHIPVRGSATCRLSRCCRWLDIVSKVSGAMVLREAARGVRRDESCASPLDAGQRHVQDTISAHVVHAARDGVHAAIPSDTAASWLPLFLHRCVVLYMMNIFCDHSVR